MKLSIVYNGFNQYSITVTLVPSLSPSYENLHGTRPYQYTLYHVTIANFVLHYKCKFIINVIIPELKNCARPDIKSVL